MARFDRGSGSQTKTDKSGRWLTTNTSREHSEYLLDVPQCSAARKTPSGLGGLILTNCSFFVRVAAEILRAHRSFSRNKAVSAEFRRKNLGDSEEIPLTKNPVPIFRDYIIAAGAAWVAWCASITPKSSAETAAL
jgi:hypothetical protein